MNVLRTPGYAKPITPLPAPVTADVVFIVPDNRRRDEDNLLASLKAAWDELVSIKLLADDAHGQLHVRFGGLQVAKNERGVLVTLRTEGDTE